jgi:CBS-domain-containing membrane protein
MKAIDVMTRDVVTVTPETSIIEAARLMSSNDVSALPVVDRDDHLIGIISEADLLEREEIGADFRRPWWMEAVTPPTILAAEFVKSHGKHVADLMSNRVITAHEDASLAEIAGLLERNRIKRVPIVRGSKLVGIVSRSNLIQALASWTPTPVDVRSEQSRAIREQLLSRLKEKTWTDFGSRNVIVTDGEVHLWGLVGSEAERKAVIALAEEIPGVARVVDEMIHAY